MRYSPYRWYFGLVSFSVLGALLYVWCHVKTLSQGGEITALRETREGLIRQQDLLRVRVASLQKARRIHEIATIELGMRFPNERPKNLYTDPGSGSVLSGSSVQLRTLATRASR